MGVSAIIRREGDRIIPASAVDAEALNGLKPGVDYRAEITRAKDPRSVQQNNLRWLVCALIADNLDGGWTKEAVNDALKIATGHVEFRQSPDGQFWRFPKPTDFGAMSGSEFTEWLDHAFAEAGVLFGPGLSDAVRAELADMIAGAAEQKDAA